MSKGYLVIDCGTTNLRVTLLGEHRKVVDAVRADGGVRHTAIDGDNSRLRRTLKGAIDEAAYLGATAMAFLAGHWDEATKEQAYAQLVKTTNALCDYAAEKGLHIVMENHGFFINGSDRVLSLIEAINRPNLKMTVDVGNFLCVDEDPVAAVKKCLPYAEMIHLKDFYIRKKEQLPDQTDMFNCNLGRWFETMGGKMLRGAILGQGDMDVWEILRMIKHSGFDGYISLEFEGMEPSEQGTEIGLSMARAILSRV